MAEHGEQRNRREEATCGPIWRLLGPGSMCVGSFLRPPAYMLSPVYAHRAPIYLESLRTHPRAKQDYSRPTSLLTQTVSERWCARCEAWQACKGILWFILGCQKCGRA